MPLMLLMTIGAMTGTHMEEASMTKAERAGLEVWSGSLVYRAGIGVAVVTSFLTVWTTIVRDDGNGIGFFMVVIGAVVGAFAAWFRPRGMARAMLGTAAMQASVGMLIATAPITASIPDGPARALLFSGFLVVLWLISADFFRRAADLARS